MKISITKRTVAVIILTTLVMLCLSGCLSEDKKELENEGEMAAAAYISRKYHFNPEIKNTDAMTTMSFSSNSIVSLSGNVLVYMEYNGKSFVVDYYPGKYETACDNYQQEDIHRLLNRRILDSLDVPAEEICVYYTGCSYQKDEMLHNYVDASNLVAEMSADGRNAKAVISLINTDVYCVDVEKIWEATGIQDILIVNYKDMDSYQDFQDHSCSIEDGPYGHLTEGYAIEYREATRSRDGTEWYEYYKNIEDVPR